MKWTRRGLKVRMLLILSVVGPGIITANVDNDAGGILTYSQAGAQFGYTLLWTFIPTTLALIVIQEMAARMGAASGKGLSDLIREEYGLRITAFMMLGVTLCNLGNVVAEFAGIAASMGLFGVSKYIAVPVCAVLVWVLVVKGGYKSVEKVFLAASGFYICYIVAGALSGPAWRQSLLATVRPPAHTLSRQGPYLYMIIGLVGTTIAPWMQFYLQSSIVEKGVTRRQYALSRIDVVVGCLFTELVAWFIVIACAATLFVHGHKNITDAADAAQALRPFAGDYAYILFSAGLFNASLFAASILPLSTAYTVCEGLGFESGVGKSFWEAPVFYWLYTILIAAGAGIILLPNVPLIPITILSQVINGAVLPFVLIFMLLLVNKKDLMGPFTNSSWYNAVAWATTIIMIVLTLVYLWSLRSGAA